MNDTSIVGTKLSLKILQVNEHLQDFFDLNEYYLWYIYPIFPLNASNPAPIRIILMMEMYSLSDKKIVIAIPARIKQRPISTLKGF